MRIGKPVGGDKQNNPLYIVFSGPGTGKSRLLEEFPRLARLSATTTKMKKFLQEGVVFHVSLENGSTYIRNNEGTNFETVIGSRMMALMSKDHLGFSNFANKTIEDALRVIRGQEPLAVFLLIDGLQMLDDEKGGGSGALGEGVCANRL
mmetsp:Transcript_3771/g.5769  ORF Transcript_3771/g.5769 Transcript_3771/m.5769 type:complete len:149 (-) Transcript_3771:631-1077(-)